MLIKKYTITIEETMSNDFKVFAESMEQAEAVAVEKYNSGEFMLAPGNLTHKQLQVRGDTETDTNWIEF